MLEVSGPKLRDLLFCEEFSRCHSERSPRFGSRRGSFSAQVRGRVHSFFLQPRRCTKPTIVFRSKDMSAEMTEIPGLISKSLSRIQGSVRGRRRVQIRMDITRQPFTCIMKTTSIRFTCRPSMRKKRFEPSLIPMMHRANGSSPSISVARVEAREREYLTGSIMERVPAWLPWWWGWCGSASTANDVDRIRLRKKAGGSRRSGSQGRDVRSAGCPGNHGYLPLS